MILGLSSSYDQHQALPIRHYVNQTTSAYAEDNWHVTPRLSLQLGFAMTLCRTRRSARYLIANFDPNLYLSSQEPKLYRK